MKVISVVTASLLTLAMVTTLFGLEKVGRSSRFDGKAYSLNDPMLPLQLLVAPEDVFAFWKKQVVRGALVVHVGRDLHFTPVDKPDCDTAATAYPVVLSPSVLEYESALNDRNFLWLAMRANMARQIVSVLPHESFRDKVSLVQEAVQKGYLGIISMDSRTIVAHELGSQRVITDSYIPSFSEPVVLNIDASIFDDYFPAELYALLEKSGLKIMLLT